MSDKEDFLKWNDFYMSGALSVSKYLEAVDLFEKNITEGLLIADSLYGISKNSIVIDKLSIAVAKIK